jgi:hypothetical protein
MNKITFVFGGEDGIRLKLDPDLCDKSKCRWRFCLLDYDGHRIALMAERLAVPKLHQFVVKHVLAPPAQLPVGQVHWFPGRLK